MEETVSGNLKIRLVDYHLNNNNTFCDTTPIMNFDENDEGLLIFEKINKKY